MRIPISRAQAEYLAEVGVTSKLPDVSRAGVPAQPAATDHTASGGGNSSIGLFVTVVLIVLGLLALLGAAAHGQTVDVSVSNAPPEVLKRFVMPQPEGIQHSGGHSHSSALFPMAPLASDSVCEWLSRFDLDKLVSQRMAIELTSSSWAPEFVWEQADAPRPSSMWPSKREPSIVITGEETLGESNSKLPRNGLASSVIVRDGAGEVVAAEMDESRRQLNQILLLCLLLIAGTYFHGSYRRFTMTRRIQNIEKQVFSEFPEGTGSTGHGVGNGPQESARDAHARRILEHAREQRETRILTPRQLMEVLIRGSKRFTPLSIAPEAPDGSPWTMGLHSVKGNVRTENQDFGVCFTIGRYQAMVIADGCGGMAHGNRAAYVAASQAAAATVKHCGAIARLKHRDPMAIAQAAMKQAASGLAHEATRIDTKGGLRTTLIIVVADEKQVGYAYIGDGGGIIIRNSGDIEPFLIPQKAEGYAPNVLAASLGPEVEGEMQSGQFERASGDLIVVGTDGVFDRVQKEFPMDLLQGFIQYQGRLQEVLEQVLTDFAEWRDEVGFLCDDNMTLGVVGTGDAPRGKSVDAAATSIARESELQSNAKPLVDKACQNAGA